MKRDRNTKKMLNDIYFLFDYEPVDEENATEAELKKNERWELVKEKYGKRFEGRYFPKYDWNEYYGLFYDDNKRVELDPKRYQDTFTLPKGAAEIMSNRNTTFYHPRKVHYSDYIVNEVVSIMNDVRKDFESKYKKIIKQSINSIKKPTKVTLADYDNFMCGVSGPMAAEAWANYTNMEQEKDYFYQKCLLLNGMYAQFLHMIASKVEAASATLYAKQNIIIKRWSRDMLYDNVNTKRISSRTLPSFKYHDKLYLIWNFLKHNNQSVYDSLKKDYPEVLIDLEYHPGDFAAYYVKFNDDLILELIDGVKQYFIEWCELNLDEDYERAQWDYDEYFIHEVDDYIETIRNPMGLDWWDELD